MFIYIIYLNIYITFEHKQNIYIVISYSYYLGSPVKTKQRNKIKQKRKHQPNMFYIIPYYVLCVCMFHLYIVLVLLQMYVPYVLYVYLHKAMYHFFHTVLATQPYNQCVCVYMIHKIQRRGRDLLNLYKIDWGAYDIQ